MQKTAKRFAATAAAAAIAIGVTVATPSAAQAAGCTGGWFCGGVTNNTYTGVAYAVGYPDTYTGTLYKGQKVGGNGSGTDVDGFGIPWNCWAGISGWSYSNTSYAPVFSSDGYRNWYKIDSNQQITVNWIACD